MFLGGGRQRENEKGERRRVGIPSLEVGGDSKREALAGGEGFFRAAKIFGKNEKTPLAEIGISVKMFVVTLIETLR